MYKILPYFMKLSWIFNNENTRSSRTSKWLSNPNIMIWQIFIQIVLLIKFKHFIKMQDKYQNPVVNVLKINAIIIIIWIVLIILLLVFKGYFFMIIIYIVKTPLNNVRIHCLCQSNMNFSIWRKSLKILNHSCFIELDIIINEQTKSDQFNIFLIPFLYNIIKNFR